MANKKFGTFDASTNTSDIRIAQGTIVQRPAPLQGQLRYNTDFNRLESFDGNAWISNDSVFKRTRATETLTFVVDQTFDNTLTKLNAASTTIFNTVLAASSFEDGFKFSVENIGTGTWTFNPSGGETINGQLTMDVPAGYFATFYTDGANWFILIARTKQLGDSLKDLFSYGGAIQARANINQLVGSYTVTITRSGAVATVATAGLNNNPCLVGDTILISGAVQPEYNGSQIVTTTPTQNTFTYNVVGTPVTPATGVITCQIFILRASENISSVVKNGTADFTANFVTPEIDEFYSVQGNPFRYSTTINAPVVFWYNNGAVQRKATTGIRFATIRTDIGGFTILEGSLVDLTVVR